MLPQIKQTKMENKMTKQNKPNNCLTWFSLNDYDFLEDFHRSSWMILIWQKSLVYNSLFKEKLHNNPTYNKSVVV